MRINWSNAMSISAGPLAKMDLLCFDFAWEEAYWREVVKVGVVRIGRDNLRREVCFWAGDIAFNENNPEAIPRLEVIKLGVLPSKRRKGLSKEILRDIRTSAQSISNEAEITMDVPEYMLYPPWEDCFIGHWLSNVGFSLDVTHARKSVPHQLYGKSFDHSFCYRLTTPQPAKKDPWEITQ